MAPKSKPAPAPAGVDYPVDGQGKRSTLGINQEAFQVAVSAIDAELGEKIRQEKKWRGKYSKYVVNSVEASLKSPEAAETIAENGLTYLHGQFQFIRDGEEVSLAAAMDKYTTGTYGTGTVKGTMPLKPLAAVPYKGKTLTGDALLSQIDKWARQGVIEMSCAAAMTQVATNKSWLDLSGRVFVLLGASSAMGPFNTLMDLGATVVAVDIDRPHIWTRLIKKARESPGTLVVPLPEGANPTSDEEMAEIAGSNLLNNPPEIRNWLRDVCKGKPLTIGAYAYLDGALFMRLSMAMDAIIADLCKSRKGTNVAYLCTPTDCHVVGPQPVQHANANYRAAPMWQKTLSLLGAKNMTKNARKPVISEDGEPFHIMDCIVTDQGPNYILAKRLQHWRCVVARSQGCRVSSNIAPSTATVSVVHNKMFALAYQGMHHYKPIEVFEQETSSAVMALLLINDVCNPLSVANPEVSISNPLCIFQDTSFHGGAWRCGYKFGGIGTGAVLAACVTNFLKFLLTSYLFLYNAIQCVGWSMGLYKLCVAWQNEDPVYSPWTQGDVGYYIGFFQYLAILEVVHAALGFVKSPVLVTAVQIYSRVALVAMMQYVPWIQKSYNVFMWCMLFAWSITEVVRYSYYALATIGKADKFKILVWLRYSLFLILYPMGVFGELGNLKSSMPAFAKYKRLEVFRQLGQMKGEIPYLVQYGPSQVLSKKWGFNVIIFPIYTIGLYILYRYMLEQRIKVLGKKDQSKAKKE